MKYILTTIVTLMVGLSGCRPIKQIEYVNTSVIEYKDRVRVDSVLSTIKDSIYINGDTVKIFRDRWRDRVKINSDTIYRDVKVVEIKKETVIEKLSWWAKAKIFIWGLVIGLIIGFILKYWVKVMTLF